MVRTPITPAALACLLVAILVMSGAAVPAQDKAVDPLPSWNEGKTKKAIIDFVNKVTDKASPDFVPVAERIATFDNDGTLWVEQPIYTQFVFVIERVKALAPQHPEWKTQEPFAAVLRGDLKALAELGDRGLMPLLSETQAGMSTADFEALVKDFYATTKHPRFKQPYTSCVYQPMLELLAYLRKHEFKTYIVSGGGIEFMRPMTEKVYGIPPEQVIGSSIKTKYEYRDGAPVLLRLPEIDFVDDKAGKPVGIGKFIGRRPIMAFGNSDGDLEMLQWTTAGKGARFGLIVHHTDAEREYAYDRKSHIGTLDKALDQAPQHGWTVVSMKDDWKRIFPFDKD